MSIVKMKRIRLIALAQDRDALLSSLLHVGCVEISEPEEIPQGSDGNPLLHRDAAGVAQAKAQLTALQHALEVLRKYAPQKKGMFAPRGTIGEKELLDEKAMAAALSKAEAINEHAKVIGQLNTRQARLHTEQLALQPWSAYDLPLEDQGTKNVSILLGTVPNAVDFDAMAGAVMESADTAWLKLLSTDREQQYMEVLVHRSQEQTALEVLRTYGFSFSQLKELTGTVAENIRRLDQELSQAEQQRQQEQEAIRALGADSGEVEVCVDRVQQVLSREDAKERLLSGGAIFCLDGWAPVPEVPALEKALKAFDCAYELTDPTPEEYPKVPVKLKNSVFSRCMNVVTEMYSLPAYDGTDPNPLMAPFFILFFGIMMADMAYGLLMIFGALFVLKKAKPREGTRNFMELVFWCGVSTTIIGAMTGGFLGDFIPQIIKIVNPESTFTMPALFTPLDDTVAIMMGSLVLGAIQVFTGMAVSVVNKIRSGDFIDALFDEITWWIILAGVALAIFGIGTVAGVPVPLTVGGLMLVFGGTRKAKGFGKVASLVGLVYNGVTGFFSDILSYVRLMALMLSGSVIASVFNTLGATFGNVILFVIVALIGNALNLALNLLGCYVHDLRLQCLEFFNRFYKEGGKPYKPLAIQTKYVDVIKEEQ
mgnify:CR=1 FL=1